MSDFIPVDSKEGIKRLVDWAKAHNMVLNLTHKSIALKFGVNIEGVLFNELIPIEKVRS